MTTVQINKNKRTINIVRNLPGVILVNSSIRENATNEQVCCTAHVRGDVTLPDNVDNVMFYFDRDNVTFNLNRKKHTMQGPNSGFLIGPGVKNVTIRNGYMQSNHKATGVNFRSVVKATDMSDLARLGEAYENTLRAKSSTGTVIEGVVFDYMNTSIYVSSCVGHTTIRRCVVRHNNRMAIYLDTGSHHTIVEHSHFLNNGMRTIEGKGKRSRFRGHISIDGSKFNTIRHNKFTDPHRKYWPVPPASWIRSRYDIPAIEAYRNCGERFPRTNIVHPRIWGANNNTIHNNRFECRLGIWLEYRRHDNLSSSSCPQKGKYPDQSNFNRIYANSATHQLIKDWGKHNTISI